MARQRRARGRKVDGILLLDKPQGLTSNQALQDAKHLFKAAKAGHTGSLDPLATGMLPLCFGEATKVSAFLLDADKYYSLVARLGQTTDTGDSEGEVRETRPVPALDRAQVEAVLRTFLGDSMQVPPMYSAIKQKGRPLYELARQGVEVEREPRPVHIESLDLIDMGPDWLRMDVHCSKGTYVRTLAEDIGEKLGCGAHVIELRRTGVGPWRDTEMVTMDALRECAEQGFAALDALLRPIDAALEHWPALKLDDDLCFYLRQGQPVQIPGAPSRGFLRLYHDTRGFIGMGVVQDDGRVAPRRLVQS